MKEDLEVDVQGLDDVLTAFNYLNAILDRREIRAGLREASKYLMQQGKQNLKSRLKGESRYLLSSITYRIKRKNSGSLVGWRPIRTDIQQKNSTRKSGAAWWVDRGTTERHSKYGNRGHITGNKFWSDVNENDTDRAMNMVAKAIQSAIAKI